MDILQLRAQAERSAYVQVEGQELKRLIDEYSALKTKSVEVAAENSGLKQKIEEYELAIVRGVEQLRETMRELYIKMHEAHELLRAVKHLGDAQTVLSIDNLLRRDGLYEGEDQGQ